MGRTPPIHAQLAIRSRTPSTVPGTYFRVVTRLAQAVSDGKLDRVDRFVWDGDDRAADTSSRLALDRFRAFTRWAADADVSLSPAFNRRRIGSPVDDTSGSVRSFPLICLAIYEGDELVAVFPHTDGSNTWTVGDALDAIEEEFTGWQPASEPTSRETPSRRVASVGPSSV